MLETKRLTDTLPPSARIHVARRRVRTWAAFSLLALCLPLSSVAAADVVCVPNDGIDASCTIGKGAATISAGVALANAAGGDTVLVNPGSYVENVGIDRDVALVSKSGRAVTTITGISSAGALGTLQVTGGTTAVQIGAPGQGFTVVGIDNGAPGIENAAIYFQGSHSGAQIIDNEIVAAGDAGLLTEYGATISGFSITDNVFSGSTYVGSPSGYGFGMQFTLPNVPRQLVVMGCGSGCTNTSSVTFSDNQIVGSSGGINPDLTGTECPIVGQTCEQGNTLVTIDADGAVITGNGFLGSTARFATSLRVRGPNTTVSGNDFDSSGLTATSGHLYLKDIGSLASAVVAANTFDKGVYVDFTEATIGISLSAAIDALPFAGLTIQVLSGLYNEPRSTDPEGTPLPMQMVVDEVVSIVGAGKNDTIIRPTGDTGSSGDSRGWFLVDTTGGLSLSDLTLDGTGRLVYQAVRDKGVGGSASNVHFKEIKFNESGPHYSGVAIAAFGSGPVDVTDSMFTEIGRIGVLYFGSGVSGAQFTSNTYQGKGVGDWLDYMVDISNGAVVDVSECVVSGNRGVASSDGSQSAGLLVSTFFGPGTTATIDSSTFEDNTTGIFSGYDTFDTSSILATCNRITGNDFGLVAYGADGTNIVATTNSFVGNGAGVDATNVTTNAVDATGNFWGSVDGPGGVGPGSGDSVSANVDFAPFETAAPACVSCTVDADCDDGAACTGVETCNVGTGMCEAGTPVDCSAFDDQCSVGTCNEPSGTCSGDPVPDGTLCDDGALCSEADTCQAGACVGGGGGDSNGNGVCDQNELPGLSLSKVKIKESTKPDRDNWSMNGELDASADLPNFEAALMADGIEVLVFKQDGGSLALVNSFAFTTCTAKGSRFDCKDLASRSRISLKKRPAPGFYKVKITVKGQNLTVPFEFDTPLVGSLRTMEGGETLDRSDSIGSCQLKKTTLKCKEKP